MMNKRFWCGIKIAAVLMVVADFLTPAAGLIGGAFDPAISEARAANPPNIVAYTPANPTGPTGTTPTMMGLGYNNEFTPRSSGIVEITITGYLANSTASDGAQVQIEYGIGNAPANAATLTGTACGAPIKITNNASTAAVLFPFTVQCFATGLSFNNAYWFDMAANQITGGAVTIGNVTIAASEQ